MNNLCKILISLVIAFIAIPGISQTHMQQWADNAEKDAAVNVTAIIKKDPTSGKLLNSTKVITFQESNKSQYDRLIDACKKDEQSAYEVITSKVDGKQQPQIYKFRQGTNDIQYIFSFPNKLTKNKIKELGTSTEISVTIVISEVKPPRRDNPNISKPTKD